MRAIRAWLRHGIIENYSASSVFPLVIVHLK